ncbi:hypothetical protein ACSVC9_08285 [Clostridium sp. LBM24168]
MDQDSNTLRNHELNHKVLGKVTGKYVVLLELKFIDRAWQLY